MKKISILDCTLRDGGYVNNFSFGKKSIDRIIDGLSQSSVDIIECGFLKSNSNDENKTLFSTVQAIQQRIKSKSSNTMYVAMIQYGAIGIDEIIDNDGKSIDGIRLTFHEHEIEDAYSMAQDLISKGYKVFFQPVGTTTYSDISLLELVDKVNKLKPYAFYIVDTLGKMYKKDILHMFYLVDHNLDERIALGFHSHNNLQMSFANAQEITQLNINRHLIIDSSILGMGRGAGNLNTELLAQYLNVNFGCKYDIFKLMSLLDSEIQPLAVSYKWGYHPSYYLAAISDSHPNYASFLMNKSTLKITDIRSILLGLDSSKRNLFDKQYIQEIYTKYMDYKVNDDNALDIIKSFLKNRNVLILAPGKSLQSQKDKICSFANDNNCFVVSVNFIPEIIPVNMVFTSNIKRFDNQIINHMSDLQSKNVPVVITSNIKSDDTYCLKVNYSSYLADDLGISDISDNAGLMCLNLFKSIGVCKFYLAGFDGFTDSARDNYFNNSLAYDIDEERAAKLNLGFYNEISLMRSSVSISYITEAK